MNSQKALEFINSGDIRDHLSKLNYAFTPLECAYLVWQSKRHNLNEKLEAWKDIIDTMPDCPVEKRLNCRGWDSLRDMLRGYIALEEKCLSLFRKKDSNAFYEYSLYSFEPLGYTPGDGDYCWVGGIGSFRSWKDCYHVIFKNNKGCHFRIAKRYLDVLSPTNACEPRIFVEYDEKGTILDVCVNNWLNFFPLTEEENDLMNHSFRWMFVDIPIPFEKPLIYKFHH